MNEQAYITRWIQQQLEADDVIEDLGNGVFVHEAPQGVPRPWLIIDPHETNDIRLMDTTRLWVKGRWTIKVVGRVVDDDPPFDTMVLLMNRVDAIMQGATDATDPDIEILSSIRTATGDYKDDSNYEHVFETFEIQGMAV